jgi:hypothetical protein
MRGMPSSELPDNQIERFNAWFAKQLEKIKQFYQEPNLQNVLDTHANKLYESAAEHFNKGGKQLISDEVAKEIVKTAFTCLTKIDQSRAVRNRMSLKEIHSILNRKDVDVETVGRVLNIFREPGNTFIRPFITDDPESNKLAEDAVLDITHESLIRNWEYLEQWAKEEFDNYAVSLDFKKQIDRWVESNKSNDFLLSMGPLTYFENWRNKVNPNAWWIARYLPEDINQARKQEKAEIILRNTQEFLRQSARKHVVTRTVVRYGPRKIAAVLAIIALFTLSSFVLRNYFQQQSGYVLENVKDQSLQLMNSKKVDSYLKSMLLAELLKAKRTTLTEIITNVNDSVAKIHVVTQLAALLVIQGRNEPKQEIRQSLFAADSLFNDYVIERSNSERASELLKVVNYLRVVLELSVLYNPSDDMRTLRNQNAERSAKLVKHILRLQPKTFKSINSLNVALENALNHQALAKDDLQKLLTILSPFENPDRSAWVQDKYAKDNLAGRGFFDYGYKFNGLYQELAYLYAAQGTSDKVLQCIDSLLKYNQNYYQNDYAAMIDNAINIAAVFFSNNQTESLDAFVKGYCLRKKIPEIEFYQRLIGRLTPGQSGPSNIDEVQHVVSNLNAEHGTHEMISFFFAQYRKSIWETVADVNARNFYLALSWKDEALIRLTKMKFSNETAGREELLQMFGTAVEFYTKTDKIFLDQEIIAAKFSDNDAAPIARKFLFLYPDSRTAAIPFEPRNFYFYYTSEFFIQYLLDNNLFDQLYKEDDNLNFIFVWFESYFACMTDPAFNVRQKANTAVMMRLEKKLTQRNALLPQLNFINAYLGTEAYQAGNSETALLYYNKFDKDKIASLLRYSGSDANRAVFTQVATSVTGLSGMGRFEDAYAIIKTFKNPINRSSLYAFAAIELLRKNTASPIARQLIDSAQIELTRIENLSTGQPNRVLIAHALVMQDPAKNVSEAYRTIKNIDNKFWPTLRISRSFAFHGDLYQAQQNIAENISDSDQIEFLWNILFGYADGQNVEMKDWKEFQDNYPWQAIRVINYINEDN